MRFQSLLTAALAAVLAFGCGGPPPPAAPLLSFTANPSSIDDQGHAAKLTVVATDEAGKARPGTITLTARAGSLEQGGLTLTADTDPDGVVTALFTCAVAADPNCTGAVRIEADWKKGSETMTQVLRVQITPPPFDGGTDVDSGTPDAGQVDAGVDVGACLVGGSVLHFEGDPGDPVHPGAATIFSGSWFASSGTNPDGIWLIDAPTDAVTYGPRWDLHLFSGDAGTPLTVGTYLGATNDIGPTRTVPGLLVTGAAFGHSCPSGSTGTFRVADFTSAGDTVMSFTAAFTQQCNGVDGGLKGCVHYESSGDAGTFDAGSPWKPVGFGTVPPLTALWGSSPSNVWAVGQNGSLLTCDTDAVCTVRAVPSTAALKGIWGSGPNDVWIVGSVGTVLHCNAGAACTVYDAGTAQPLNAVWGTGPGDVWVVGGQGTTLHWDGGAWGAVSSGATLPLNSIWGSGAADIWAGGNLGTLVHWTGSSWTSNSLLNFGDVTSVSGLATNDVWAVSNTGNIVHWNGASWISSPSPASGPLNGVASLPVTGTYVAGDNGQFLVWQGTGWGNASDTAANLTGIWAGGGALWVTGADGTVHRRLGEDAGVISITGGAAPSLLQVWGTGPSNVWAVGTGGNIAHWDGTSFKAFALTTAALSGLWGVSASDAWAVGSNGTIVHFDGGNWGRVPASGPVEYAAVWGSASADVWAGGSDDGGPGGVGMISHWNGANWTSAPTGGAPGVGGMWGSGTGDVWAAGGLGSLTHWNGSNWVLDSQINVGNWRGIWGSSATDLWVAGSGGAIAHWDGGAWSSDDAGVPANLNGAWGSSPTDLWLVGSGGTTVHRVPGPTWVKVPGPGTLDLQSVWGSSANDVWAVGAGPTVLHYP